MKFDYLITNEKKKLNEFTSIFLMFDAINYQEYINRLKTIKSLSEKFALQYKLLWIKK